MKIQQRVEILLQLGNYLQSNNDELKEKKELANYKNSWFTLQFIDIALENIINEFLNKEKIEAWLSHYSLPEKNQKVIGLVMAGNIPLVGFHDLLCCFISGHKVIIKLSSKDDVLIKHIVEKMMSFSEEIVSQIYFADTLKNCDAYIATGSNNSSRYFELYFGKYPNIIRKNRTSVAILTGKETAIELENLAKDIQLFFGQGCRNVTHLFVPTNYNFEPLIQALKKYQYFLDLHKYKNNYDYQLSILMLNKHYYMTDGSIILVENKNLFSAISTIHYSFYEDLMLLENELKNNENIQCIVGNNHIPFGQAQIPKLNYYADGVDTMTFLCNL